MNLLLKFRSRKLFVTLFLSFLLFLLAPVAVFFYTFYHDMIGYYEQEISNSTLSKLTVVKNTIDGKFEELGRNAIRLSTDKSLDIDILEELQHAGTPKDTDHLLKVKNISDVINNIKNINPAIQSVYMYNRNSNLVVNSDAGIYSLDEFPDKAWIEQYNNGNQKKLLIGSRKVGQFTWDHDPPQHVVTLVYPLTAYTQIINGSIAINIYENSLYPFIHSMNADDSGFTFVADKNGSLFLYDRNSSVQPPVDDLAGIARSLVSKPGSGHFTTRIGATQYLITYSWSSANGLAYAGASPINSLFNNANIFKFTVTVISAVFLILGLALSYLISNRIYRPILRIVENIQSHKGASIAGYKNELQLISGSIADIMQESERMSGVLAKKDKDLKQLYVLNLINGIPDHHEDTFPFAHPHFVCIVASIDKYYEFTRRYTYEEQYFLKLLLLKGCEEIIQTRLSGIGAMLEREKLVFVLNLTSEQAAAAQKWITAIYANWEKEILRSHKLSLSVGFGNSYVGKENINFSYLEALEAVKYKLVQGHGSIIAHAHLSDSPHDELHNPANRETRILNYLDTQKLKRDELIREIKELIAYFRTQNQLSYDTIIQTIYQLVGNTIKHLVGENQKITDIFPGHNNLSNELSEKETLSEIELWLVWLYETIIDYRGKEFQNNNRHIQAVIDFIHDHFKRSDLDITTVSEATGLSYPYLRKIFKNHLGVNVTDYIHNLRIKEAKKLLRDTEMTIKEIAEQAGYTNDQSFTRNFKKSEGVTPGEYRGRTGK